MTVVPTEKPCELIRLWDGSRFCSNPKHGRDDCQLNHVLDAEIAALRTQVATLWTEGEVRWLIQQVRPGRVGNRPENRVYASLHTMFTPKLAEKAKTTAEPTEKKGKA